jgi:hypothetical protein
MRYFASAFAGILVGVVLAAVVVYYNPLTMRAARSVENAWTLRYSVPDRDLIALTHYERLPLPLKPAGVDSLWEQAIRSAVLSVVSLHETAGKAPNGAAANDVSGGDAAALDVPVAAVATRLTVPSEATDLLLRGALLDDYWLVTVPGEGSLFVHDLNNLWPALRENVVPVSLLGLAWHGPAEYRTTLGPRGPRGPGFVLGASGRFAGVSGDAGERYLLNRYSRGHGAEDLAGEIALDLSAPPPDAAAAAASAAAPAAAAVSDDGR